MQLQDDEKTLYPTRTESRAPSIRFNTDNQTRDTTPAISRQCSKLLEKPSGPEYRSDAQDPSRSGSLLSVIPPTTSTMVPSRITVRIAGPRFTLAECVGLGRWQQWLTVLGCFMLYGYVGWNRGIANVQQHVQLMGSGQCIWNLPIILQAASTPHTGYSQSEFDWIDAMFHRPTTVHGRRENS